MPRLAKRYSIRQLDCLPPGVDVVAALSDGDAAPGVALMVEGEPVLVLPLAQAILFRDWLTEEIAEAGKLAAECGENVRRASKARRN